MTDKKEKLLKIISPILLVITALIWGTAFIAQSEGGEIGSFTFQAIRCYIAFIAVGAVKLIMNNTGKNRLNKKKYGSLSNWIKGNKRLLVGGSLCGIFLTCANNFQQFGIDLQGKETSTGRAAFLTALYIILVPVINALVFKKKPSPLAWFSVAVAVCGLYLISIKPGAGFNVSTADILLIICALFYSLQIIAVDRHADQDGISISMMQQFIAATISLVLMLIFENPSLSAILSNTGNLLYAGVMSGGIAYTLQILGQKRCNNVLAVLLMSLESVFSGIFDWIIRGNTMSSREIFGCVVMFIAIIIAQLPDFRIKKKK